MRPPIYFPISAHFSAANGVTIIADSPGQHISKGCMYFATGIFTVRGDA
jgi:hypothetical protein